MFDSPLHSRRYRLDSRHVTRQLDRVKRQQREEATRELIDLFRSLDQ